MRRNNSTNPTLRVGLDRTTRRTNQYAEATGNQSLIYMGIVEDDEDPEHEGAVRVSIPSLTAPTRSPPGQASESEYRDRYGWYKCSPLLPFFGTNDAREARDGFSHSYGLWGGNPRKGDAVAVVFINGISPHWFGCMP